MEKATITLVTAEVCTILYFLFGEFDIALQCLLVFIALDYISGLIKAYCTKTLSSKIGFKGILKKVGILAIVALSVSLDRLVGNTGAMRTFVIYYFVANEGLSVLENFAEAGIPIPNSIKKALKNIKKEYK